MRPARKIAKIVSMTMAALRAMNDPSMKLRAKAQFVPNGYASPSRGLKSSEALFMQ